MNKKNSNTGTKKSSAVRKGRHLSYGKRCSIEALLSEGYSLRAIAERIGCSPSTVSREVRRNITNQRSHTNDCAYRNDCAKHHVCGSPSCNKRCKTCNRCKKHCTDYVKSYCSELESRGVCNGCHKLPYCSYDKTLYKAEIAEERYRDQLVECCNGFDLTCEDIERINSQVSPLIKKGQSPFHIKHTLGTDLMISESTLRRMINRNELDVRPIDLKEAVKRKPRHTRVHSELPSASKSGHLYEEYREYIETHDVNVVEMDCVEGKKEDKCAILTLHFVTFHMQLYFIMPEHTAECVVAVLDMLEETLGEKLFKELFPVILTDNGHEFTDIEGMERSVSSGKRTRIFFCEPNRSDQKGSCENNHKIFRCVVPKGTSIDRFMQSDMNLITNHVNSYRRRSLYGKSPYDNAMLCIPSDFFLLLGLEVIPSEQVVLTPELVKHRELSR